MSSKIKIIYILNSSTKHGGANKSFLSMIEGLCEKNIEPLVVVPEYGDICVEFEKKNIPYTIVKCLLAVYPSRYYFKDTTLRDVILFIPRIIKVLIVNSIANRKITKAALEFKADLIHTNVGPIHNGHTVAKKIKVPHVWHIREYQDLDFNLKPLFSKKGFRKKLSFYNNYPIAITNGIFRHFSLNNRARVINNGIFKIACTQFNIKKKLYFLFAGRLEPNKGIQNLIAAFIEFAQENDRWELYIAGDTPDLGFKTKLMEMSKQIDITERIKFLGMRDDIGDVMASATALVVPSIHEGFGRITVEAMFNGCLVIGYNSAGTKEILEKEDLGILYTDHTGLVDALKAVADNGIESYFDMIERARQRAITLYSQEQNVNAVYEYYHEILANYTK